MQLKQKRYIEIFIRRQKINQKQIHDFLEIKPSSMTKLIRLLQAKDLIRKEADPDDTRNRIIRLTERGMEIKRICIENMISEEIFFLKRKKLF